MPLPTVVGPLTVAVFIVLSAGLDAGRAGHQTAVDPSPPAARRWQPMPFFPPGASVVLLVGDPLREAGYMYVRFPGGYAPRLHSHKATERIFVAHGTLALRTLDGDEMRKPEGEYFVVKSGTVHETACVGPGDCFCYISIDRAFDVVPYQKP